MAKQESRVTILQEALRLAILEQALEPGMKLPEDTIGEEFGVSRTIVRRALERLAADELVEILPNRSASVIRPTIQQAHDLFQVRIDIEDIVVRRLHGRTTPVQLDQLLACVASEEAAHQARSTGYIRLSAQFHTLLAEMTGSPLLERYVRQLVWRSAIVLRLYGRPDWEDHSDEHRALIDLLVSGDLGRCRDAMRHHLESVLTQALEGAKIAGDPSLKHILARYARAATAPTIG
jgi:DNA-binding GntR family transcriptional regulator